jgi:hypothetical protein
MKLMLSGLGLCILLSLSVQTQAQRFVEPDIFDEVGDSSTASRNDFVSLMDAPKGKSVELPLGSKRFKGLVMHNVQKYPNLRTMIIELPNQGGALYQLSAIVENDKSISYTGVIISDKRGEVLELRMNKAGNYYYRKLIKEDVIQD